jgi:hypothetical protein
MFVVILVGIGDHVIDDVRECGMAHIVQKAGDLFLERTAGPADAEHHAHGVVVSTEIATFSDQVARTCLMDSLEADHRRARQERNQQWICYSVVAKDRITDACRVDSEVD